MTRRAVRRADARRRTLRHGDVDHDALMRAGVATQDPRVVRVARHAHPGAANPFESVLRAIAPDVGLDVVPQYEIRAAGLLLHPDLADPVRGIVLEADSWSWHADTVAHDRDCARYNALTVAGWVVLRITWAQVMLSPAYVTATLRALRALKLELEPRIA